MIRGRSKGFTIVELLVILVILGILAAMMIPRLTRGRMRAFHTACVQNVRNIGTALQTYSNDNLGLFPTDLKHLTEGPTPILKALPTCPSDDSNYETLYQVDNTTHRFTVACNGIHERQLDGDVKKGYPQFYTTGELDTTGLENQSP